MKTRHRFKIISRTFLLFFFYCIVQCGVGQVSINAIPTKYIVYSRSGWEWFMNGSDVPTGDVTYCVLLKYTLPETLNGSVIEHAYFSYPSGCTPQSVKIVAPKSLTNLYPSTSEYVSNISNYADAEWYYVDDGTMLLNPMGSKCLTLTTTDRTADIKDVLFSTQIQTNGVPNNNYFYVYMFRDGYFPNDANGYAIYYSMPTLTITTPPAIKFTYDESGNRIRRFSLSVKSLNISTPTQSNLNQSLKKAAESADKYTVNVYPNPTQGNLKVTVDNYPTELKGTILIYDASGKKILTVPMQSTSNDLDVSNLANGTYILHVQIGTETTKWKVIKN